MNTENRIVVQYMHTYIFVVYIHRNFFPTLLILHQRSNESKVLESSRAGLLRINKVSSEGLNQILLFPDLLSQPGEVKQLVLTFLASLFDQLCKDTVWIEQELIGLIKLNNLYTVSVVIKFKFIFLQVINIMRKNNIFTNFLSLVCIYMKIN